MRRRSCLQLATLCTLVSLARRWADRAGHARAVARRCSCGWRWRRCWSWRARSLARFALRDGADRALSVHRRRELGRDDPLRSSPAMAASRRRWSRTWIWPTSRLMVNRCVLDAQAGGDSRAGPPAGRAPRDRRAAQRRCRRDARPRAHAQGGRGAGERAATDARGGRLLGRVRRPARRDPDGRQAL